MIHGCCGHAHRCWGRDIGISLSSKAVLKYDIEFGDCHAGEEESVRLVRCEPAPKDEERVEGEAVAGI